MDARFLVPTLLILMVATGCSSEPRTSEPTERSSAPQAIVTPSAEGNRVALSLEQHGSTVALSTDDRVTLVLGDRYRWTDPIPEGARVEVSALVSDAPDGAQFWDITLLEPGTVVLRAEGSPACRPTTPGCPDRDRTYVVTLQIER